MKLVTLLILLFLCIIFPPLTGLIIVSLAVYYVVKTSIIKGKNLITSIIADCLNLFSRIVEKIAGFLEKK
ncbi:hypothetical protein COS83_00370 [archaeon CG07_land_8_20_14_0_80_38_8]|nr:MAG: hypothetical protein COS83_00370 [archaeon CG07_land_8_20_14_0_80_38_8]PIU88535.1 MAG: hypothetical protein COS64_03485 [archaeon CG06_land_8_20_14_3_00_37_11]